ncbi:MAG: NAD(+) synthase [Sphaerochaetaceae bacterium]|nr:NAD(+) synthase [Sphaerochaetaceae bacterium]
MKDGFVRCAAVSPSIKVADCSYNGTQIMKAIDTACEQQVRLLVFPELAVTGYTCADLFLQQSLAQAAERTLLEIVAHTEGRRIIVVVGVPLAYGAKLYNCAAVVCDGELLGVVPKTNLPNYQEFYERRWFNPAPPQLGAVMVGGVEFPFGSNLLFRCEDLPEFCLAVEICEDLWVPCPPSISHAQAGATIIANVSASDETTGKAEYRKSLVEGQSARLLCGYIYCDAGEGESTTDLVFTGNDLICEDGICLAEHSLSPDVLLATEIDVQKLTLERRRLTTFEERSQRDDYFEIAFRLPVAPCPLTRPVARFPFVPSDGVDRVRRCETILALQALGLKKRLEHTNAASAIVGLSGGLDSTLALLVVARAFDSLGWERKRIIAVTMPGFGTTKRTKGNAGTLAEALGATLRMVDINESVRLHFKDIGHDPENHDVTYENSQARERTQILMDIANQSNGLVIGTGDLSELALGWATYNGDHMSMYGVNASIPKTLVRHLVRHVADISEPALKNVLYDILATPVSPELLPASEDGTISQVTEDIVGPYELHDFFLYHIVRWGFSPAKVLRLALYAFDSVYDTATIQKWLKTFYRRFFSQQFKRSCLPDGPKVGSVTLSPRGDWRMPSDASASLWMRELEDACAGKDTER